MTSNKLYRWTRRLFGARSFVKLDAEKGNSYMVFKTSSDVTNLVNDFQADGWVEKPPPNVDTVAAYVIGAFLLVASIYVMWHVMIASSHM